MKHALLILIALLHWAIIAYGLLAWVWPDPVWLTVHLIAVPAMVIQWRFNDDVCILNSLESWLRTGKWRDSEDPHQGGWIVSLFEKYAGLRCSPGIVNWLIYGLLAISWSISLVRLLAVLKA